MGKTVRPVAAVLAACGALLLTSCTANPPPPIESTESPKTTTAAAPSSNTVVVAIDEIGVGFNPHLLADQSPTSAAVASLVLPSPFRPVLNPAGGTDWVPDNSVVVSAQITAQEPFTLSYQVRDDAQWSDGAPVAAEDFRYLWQEMINDPGVTDPAGYDLIENVASSGGGKTVTVTMKAPYPAWRELFTDLLPSHLIKDAPGGFSRGLADTIPVSGSRFHIKSIDRGRDEILLERNDRFWDQPARPDQILMRRGGSAAQLADSMRSDDAHVAEVKGGASTHAQLSAIPGVRTGTMFQPRVLQVALNARVGPMADTRVRAGLLGMLDPDLLAAVGADSTSSAQPARAQVLAPSDPGYVATAPTRPSMQAAYDQLTAAGWSVAPITPEPAATTTATVAPTSPPLVKDGNPLAVRIGVPQDDDTAIAVANTAADQWRTAGIIATVRELTPENLYGTDLLDGNVDAVIGWVRAGSDPATALASRFGCPPAASVSAATGALPTPAGSATPTPTPGQSVRAPSNLSGVCDPALQPGIEAALRGVGDVPAVIAGAEPALWALSTVLPVLQDNTVVAAGPGVSGVSLTGPIQTGIFWDAAGWTRVSP